jgi:replicative DNA helicase
MTYEVETTNDIRVETYVLAALIIEGNRQHHIPELKPEYFHNPVHQDLCRAMIEMYERRTHIDMISLARHCIDKKYLPTPHDIATITSGISGAANIDTHIKYLYQMYGLRKFARIGAEIVERATKKGADPFQLADELQGEIDGFVNQLSRDPVQLDRMVLNEIQRIGNKASGKSELVPASGWNDLDMYTSGMAPGEMWVLAGRPGMGKTAMAVALLQSHCKAGGKGLMFSLEMENSALAQRIISGETDLPSYKIRKGEVNEDDMRRMLNYSNDLDSLKIWFEDTPHTTIEKIRARVKTMKQKHGITCVVCDYLGLVTPTDSKQIREQQVAHISKTAKQIAKECGVTFIMLAQLNRESEKRADKRPMLSDLRESGAIEQDADIVMFPFRPAYYEQGQEMMTKTQEEAAELHIAKNRNGVANVVIPVTFVPGLASYKLRAPFQTF